MANLLREYWHHERPAQPDSQGRHTIYCRKCGRAIIKAVNSPIRSVTKCQICILKEQGVLNAEEHVLTQYQMTIGLDGAPIPIDADISTEAGMLVLYPEEDERRKKIPMVGGLFGAARSLFRVLGFDIPKEAEPVSKEIAVQRQTEGLYGAKQGKE